MVDAIKNGLNPDTEVRIPMSKIYKIIGVIVFAAGFYFTTTGHVNNDDIHVTAEQIIKLNSTLEKLRWDLDNLSNRGDKRYKRLESAIKDINDKFDEQFILKLKDK